MSALFIVTGASRGIGLALAKALCTQHAHGLHLITVSRTFSSELSAHAALYGAELTQWQYDLRRSEQVAGQLAQWLDSASRWGHAWKRVCLINNAGMQSPRIGPVSQSDTCDLEDVLQVNLLAPMALTSVFLRHTESWSSQRQVLNISSGLARVPMSSMAAYGAAKAGLEQFTRCVALEERSKPEGAHVSAIAPGVVDTAMLQQMCETDDTAFSQAKAFRYLYQFQRVASSDEVAAQLLSRLDASGFGDLPVQDLNRRAT